MSDVAPRIDTRVCERCGHLAEFHRMDDAGPPPTAEPTPPFRCTGQGFGGGCECPDLVTSQKLEIINE